MTSEAELQFQVVIDADLASKVKGVVALGDFELEGEDSVSAIYKATEAHVFYRDLIFGRPFPLVLVTRGIENLGVLLGITLFLHRDLAIHPGVPGLFAALNMADFHGVAGLAHIDRDLSRFCKFLKKFIAEPRNKKEQQEALSTSVGWLRSYLLEGTLPALPPEKEPPRIIDRGTNGFVVATSSHGDLLLGWEELYRSGFLRGVLLYYQVGKDRWKVLGARKSGYLAFDLKTAAAALNEVEAAMGELADWATDGYWLTGPEEGTLILPSNLLEVLVRV
jgi:hypothetical protein